jgi:CBS domain-containing protein
MRARDVMSRPVVFMRPRVPADVAAALLVAHGFTAAPVVDDDGRVVGIATEKDLVRGRIVPERWTTEEQPEPVVG